MMTEILYVAAQGHTFCIDIAYVKKIIQLPELEVLPGAPSDVAGMLNIGGNIIPVYDLAMMLGVERSEQYTINTMIVVCAFEENEVGLIVDAVQGQSQVALVALSDTHHIKSADTYLESMITLNNAVVMVPAMKKIISRQINLVDNV